MAGSFKSMVWDYYLPTDMHEASFLLSIKHLNGWNEKNTIGLVNFTVSLCAGLIYGFSGVFLSNAEHIMIIISAAWVPYSLYFSEKYIETKKIIDLMTTGLFTALILLGGYPEVLYDLFLILIPWMIYWKIHGMNDYKINLIIKKTIAAILQLFAVVVVTFLCSAITAIPFVKIMPELTRSGGQSPMSPPLISILGMFFPVGIDSTSGFEPSMGLFYFGILTIMSIPMAIVKKKDNTIFFFIMFVVTLYTCLGENSLIHKLLYRYAPLYSTFRFPTLFRIFACVFALLLASKYWQCVIEGTENAKNNIFVITGAILICVVILFVVKKTNSLDSANDCNGMVASVVVMMLLCTIHIFFIVLEGHFNWNQIHRSGLFIIIVLFEVLVIHREAFPFTIASYDYLNYFTDSDVRASIIEKKNEYLTRNKDCNFSGSNRSNSNLNSAYIAFNKTFDEGGYLSVKLKKTESYKQSNNCSIIRNQPEVYFTNDIVCENELPLSKWLELTNIPSNEVHTQDYSITKPNETNDAEEVANSEYVSIREFGFNSIILNVNAPTDGIIVVLQSNYSGWLAQIDGKGANIVEIDGCFIGVPITKGNHSIILKYRPYDFYLGLFISSAYIFLYVFLLVNPDFSIMTRKNLISITKKQ